MWGMQGSQHCDHFHACTTAPGNTKSTAFVITNTICIIRPGKTLICILLLLTKPGWSLKFTENLKCTFHFLKEELFSWTSFISFFLILAWSMCTYLYLSMYMGSFYTNSSKLKFLNQLEAPQLLFLKIPKFRNSFFVFFVFCIALSLRSVILCTDCQRFCHWCLLFIFPQFDWHLLSFVFLSHYTVA